jgi:hypothetical protein
MMKIPRFLLLSAGIAIAGAGAIGFDRGYLRTGIVVGTAGMALAAAEIFIVGRRRARNDAQLELDLRAAAARLDAPDMDEDWVHREFGGRGGQ